MNASNKTKKLLKRAEITALLASSVGALVSIIYESIIFFVAPVSLSVFLNFINRREYEKLIDKQVEDNLKELNLNPRDDSLARLHFHEAQQNTSESFMENQKNIDNYLSEIRRGIQDISLSLERFETDRSEIHDLKEIQYQILAELNEHSNQKIYLEFHDIIKAEIESRFDELKEKLSLLEGSLSSLPTSTIKTQPSNIEIDLTQQLMELQASINTLKSEKVYTAFNDSLLFEELKREMELMLGYLNHISNLFCHIEGDLDDIEKASRSSLSRYLKICYEFLRDIQPMIERWREEKGITPNYPDSPKNQSILPNSSTSKDWSETPRTIGQDLLGR